MSKIARIEMGRFDYPVVGQFKFLKPGPDGKVYRPSILIRITDDDGAQGWGQAVPVPTWTYETVETVETTLERYLAPVLIGADAFDLENVHTRMNDAIKPAFTIGQPLCKAAVDLACYDLIGRKSGRSVCDLLGGSNQTGLTLSWTVASSELIVVEQQLEEGRRRGYRHFNIKVGAPQTPGYDVALARKVRAFAPDGFLWADANTGYDLGAALAIAPKLADAGVDVLESPLPPNRISGYQALKRQGALPILMDEGLISPVEVEEFIRLEMIDGIAMKPARCAGIRNSERIIRIVQEEGLLLLGSGLTDPDLALAAAVQVYTWAGITHPCALNGPQFLADRLSGDSLVPLDDRLLRPGSQGLGITLDGRAEACLRVIGEE